MLNTIKGSGKISVAALAFSLAACGIIGERGTNQSGSNDYQDATEVPRTEIPADYNTDSIVDLYPVPELSNEADESFIDSERLPLPTPVTNDAKDLVQLQMLSERYWVLVKETPSQVWAKIKQFSEQSNFTLISEQPNSGQLMLKSDDNLIYRLAVIQGLQVKSAEISLRVMLSPHESNQIYPVFSDRKSEEIDTLESLALFLTQHDQQTAYSYAAQSISTKKRIKTQSEIDGIRYIIIYEANQRTKASLKQALLGAGFQLQGVTEKGALVARFMPQLPDENQPGFILRLFGVKPKGFDGNIEFAGESYEFTLSNFASEQGAQKLKIAKSTNFEWESESSKKRELNTVIMMVKRSLY